MKFLYYIKYFLYISWNWNIRLAAFCIYHEIRGEAKYGLNTVHLNSLENLEVKGNNKEQAEIYQGANYYLLENIFLELQKLQPGDGFLDIGCGKGRAMVVAAHYGFKNINGIDFALKLCQQAELNCNRISQKLPSAYWKVIHANADHFVPTNHIHVIFFFNPFQEMVMKRVIANITKSLRNNPRKLFIVYINPQYKHLFTNNGFKEVYYHRKMQYVEASILQNL